MSEEEEEITFQDTVEWASVDRKNDKKKGIHLFYLVMGAIVVLILIILIVYLIGRDPDAQSALEMMQDEEYDQYEYEDITDRNNINNIGEKEGDVEYEEFIEYNN